ESVGYPTGPLQVHVIGRAEIAQGCTDQGLVRQLDLEDIVLGRGDRQTRPIDRDAVADREVGYGILSPDGQPRDAALPSNLLNHAHFFDEAREHDSTYTLTCFGE
ncbi:MAG TPA: hypothetical protein VJK02_10955, partial [Anaerolineales bacterium]|nr:hypothetical protein [Anaerolineales bacterium]